MWHFRTKLGTFWVVEAPGQGKGHYYLGINETKLGEYQKKDAAVEDVCKQTTGHLEWDSLEQVTVPGTISQWKVGEPADWSD